MHLSKFPDHTEFQSWIVNFRTEVCSKAENTMLALQWVKEVEVAKSLDDLITPRSITGKIPRLWELDLMMATALKKRYDKQTRFRKKISVEEQRVQKKQSVSQSETHCSFDSRILSCHWVLWRDTVPNGFVQHQKWRTTTFRILMYVGSKYYYWQVILHRTKFWEDCTSPKYKNPPKLTQLWHHRIKKFWGGWRRDCHRLRNVRKNCILSKLKGARISGFRARLHCVEPWLKERDKILLPNGRQDNALSGKQLGLALKGKSCSFLHKPASGNREVKVESARGSCFKPANERVKEGNEQTPFCVPKVRARTDVKSSTNVEARPATRARIPYAWRAICKISSCDFRHPPVCRNYKSEKRWIYGSNCLFRHADGEEKLRKRSKKESTHGAVAILKHRKVQGCVSQNSDPKKSILRKAGQVRGNASAGHTIRFSGRTRYEIRIRDTKGPSQGIIQNGDTHERNRWALKFEERTPKETLRQEDCAGKAAWWFGEKNIQAHSRW